ncbi:MAG TPA: hypothetical protein VD833_09635 [Vicinamibacterales bacterium]|nr:hypothetical protein [Vicinamibacterales bacterium]
MLFRELLESLTKADVRFVVIGGVALVLRGSARLTVDRDKLLGHRVTFRLKAEATNHFP